MACRGARQQSVGLFKFAATCNFEIGGTEYADAAEFERDHTNGFGDNALGIQYRFAHQKKYVPAMAIVTR